MNVIPGFIAEISSYYDMGRSVMKVSLCFNVICSQCVVYNINVVGIN